MAVVLVVASTIAACAWLRPAIRTDVSLVGVRITDVDVFQTSAVFTVRIDNEEPFPVVVDGSVHRIAIDGREVGKGMLPDRIDLPRLSSVEIEVPVQISNVAVIGRIRSAIEHRSFFYRIDSTLYALWEGRSREVDVTREGFLDLGDRADLRYR
jgi:LEA14-like dessication related protein